MDRRPVFVIIVIEILIIKLAGYILCELAVPYPAKACQVSSPSNPANSSLSSRRTPAGRPPLPPVEPPLAPGCLLLPPPTIIAQSGVGIASSRDSSIPDHRPHRFRNFHYPSCSAPLPPSGADFWHVLIAGPVPGQRSRNRSPRDADRRLTLRLRPRFGSSIPIHPAAGSDR